MHAQVLRCSSLGTRKISPFMTNQSQDVTSSGTSATASACSPTFERAQRVRNIAAKATAHAIDVLASPRNERLRTSQTRCITPAETDPDANPRRGQKMLVQLASELDHRPPKEIIDTGGVTHSTTYDAR